jgi:uncharacterized protein (TIGR03000 family)
MKATRARHACTLFALMGFLLLCLALQPGGAAPKEEKKAAKEERAPIPVSALTNALTLARSSLADERTVLAEARKTVKAAEARLTRAKESLSKQAKIVARARSKVENQESRLGQAIERIEGDLVTLKQALGGKGQIVRRTSKPDKPKRLTKRYPTKQEEERPPLHIDSQAETRAPAKLDDALVEKILEERKKKRDSEPMPEPEGKSSSRQENVAKLKLRVPQKARVWVDGYNQNDRGKTRIYESPALQENDSHKFKVRVQWKDGAGKHVQRKEIKVEAGKQKTARIGR